MARSLLPAACCLLAAGCGRPAPPVALAVAEPAAAPLQHDFGVVLADPSRVLTHDFALPAGAVPANATVVPERSCCSAMEWRKPGEAFRMSCRVGSNEGRVGWRGWLGNPATNTVEEVVCRATVVQERSGDFLAIDQAPRPYAGETRALAFKVFRVHAAAKPPGNTEMKSESILAAGDSLRLAAPQRSALEDGAGFVRDTVAGELRLSAGNDVGWRRGVLKFRWADGAVLDHDYRYEVLPPFTADPVALLVKAEQLGQPLSVVVAPRPGQPLKNLAIKSPGALQNAAVRSVPDGSWRIEGRVLAASKPGSQAPLVLAADNVALSVPIHILSAGPKGGAL